MERIVLISPLYAEMNTAGRHTVEDLVRLSPPVGIVYLYAALANRFPDREIIHLDYNVYLDDYSRYKSLDEYQMHIERELKLFADNPPKVFCISLNFTSAYPFFSLIAGSIRRIYPNSTICCGGSHASAATEYLLQESFEADYIVCGEGDSALPDLVERLLAGAATTGLRGVHSKNSIRRMGDGSVEYTVPPEVIDLDYSAYDQCLDMEKYVAESSMMISISSKRSRTFSIMASRGCPGNCSFCSAVVMHGHRSRWRSLDNIREEILWLFEKHGVTRIHFWDDNYCPEDKMLELLEMLRSISGTGIDFTIQHMSVNHTDEKILDAMIAAGIKAFPVALESGVTETLKTIGKTYDRRKAQRLCDYAKEKGLFLKALFMIGVPGESREAMRESIDFALSLDADWLSVSVATPLPGTRMYDQFIELGYIPGTPDFWEKLRFSSRQFDTREISARDLTEMAFRTALKNNYFDIRLLRTGRIRDAELLYQNVTETIKNQIFAFDALRRIYRHAKNPEKENAMLRRMESLMQTDQATHSYIKYFDLLESDIRDRLIKASTTSIHNPI